MTRAELKAEAKNKLRGNWGWAAVIGIVMILIFGLASGPNLNISFAPNRTISMTNFGFKVAGYTGSSLIAGFFMLSAAITFLKFSQGVKEDAFKASFSAFLDGRFAPELLNYLMSYIFDTLWTMLFIIPGIVKSYSYAMTPYIVSDWVDSGKNVKFTAGVTASKNLMKGHKWDLFVLDLSFIGWNLLGWLTLGIGFIWIIPYEQLTKANFYRQLAGDQFRQ